MIQLERRSRNYYFLNIVHKGKNMSDIEIFAIPVVIALITGAIGWTSVHKRAKALFWTVFGLTGFVSAMLFTAGALSTGWDGIIYFVLLVLGGLPAAAAVLIGGGIGLVTRPQLGIPS